jgi:two-component system, NtrC family, sensor kinase
MSMFEVFAGALRPIAGESGLAFVRGVPVALVKAGAVLAVVAERLGAAGRVRPLAAYGEEPDVENLLGTVADLATLEERARAISRSGADAEWRCESPAADVVVCVLAPATTIEPLNSIVTLVAKRAAAEIARVRIERAEERYRLVSNAIGEVVWEWTVGSDVIEWDENLTNVFGYDPKTETELEVWLSRIHAADRARVQKSLDEVVAAGGTRWTSEYRFTRGDGSLAFVRDRAVVLSDATGARRMIGSMADITETKALEQRVVLAERMASMGTLAAGVAHEINNPLAYVKGNIEHVLDELRGRSDIDSDLLSALEEAREGAERVRRIVHELRVFSRPSHAGVGPADLDRVVESALTIAGNEIRRVGRLEKIFRGPPLVAANEARLGQVVLNLIVNAVQSMQASGARENVLRIETGVADDGRAFVAVSDTGAGIPAESLGRIFDPFFTTKPVGEGTGLGLSIAHAIVTGLGGEIAVDSAPDAGSTFRVLLPTTPPTSSA